MAAGGFQVEDLEVVADCRQAEASSRSRAGSSSLSGMPVYGQQSAQAALGCTKRSGCRRRPCHKHHQRDWGEAVSAMQCAAMTHPFVTLGTKVVSLQVPESGCKEHSSMYCTCSTEQPQGTHIKETS